MSQKAIFAYIVTAIILVAAIVLQIKRSFFDTPEVPLSPSPVATSTPSPASSTNTDNSVLIPKLTTEQKELVKSYLKLHLSQLSPAPEVLGGHFYLTEFIITSSSSADIAYEDGHNSFNAQINFSINNDLVSINNFTIISQNNQRYLAPPVTSSTSGNRQ